MIEDSFKIYSKFSRKLLDHGTGIRFNHSFQFLIVNGRAPSMTLFIFKIPISTIEILELKCSTVLDIHGSNAWLTLQNTYAAFHSILNSYKKSYELTSYPQSFFFKYCHYFLHNLTIGQKIITLHDGGEEADYSDDT